MLFYINYISNGLPADRKGLSRQFALLSWYFRLPIFYIQPRLQANRTAWIELPLIVNNRFLPLFYDMLSDQELRESVCECLYEVKLNLFQDLEPLGTHLKHRS